MGSKTLSLRDNQQKRKNNYELNSLDFMGIEQGGEILTIFVNCT
jgi:hypothetical protein